MEEIVEIDRGLRRKIKPSEIICPVCEITIMPGDIEHHYELEIDRLIKLQLNSKLKKLSGNSVYQEPTPGCSSKGELTSCPWSAFQKIRDNRHSRLKIKSKKRKGGEMICPVCNKYPNEDINIHIEKCLKNENMDKNEDNYDDDKNIDVECDSFEEYEWAGQKRVRASSFLEGGYSVAGLCVRNAKDEVCDEELNVDGDDTQLYGPPQYSERNIIVPLSHENDKEFNTNTYLRELVCVQEVSVDPVKNGIEQNYESSSNITLIEKENNSNYNDFACNNTVSSNNKSEQINNLKNGKGDDEEKGNVNQIVESLKVKIRELESQVSSKNKCLICMDVYFKPVVSICCWHVHCENCWLRTLGARKLCPQCNMITSPTDLRRIFL